MTKKIIMEIPKEEPIKFNADLVLEILQKHRGPDNFNLYKKKILLYLVID